MRKFLFIALVLLVGTNIFLFKRLDSVKKERNRWIVIKQHYFQMWNTTKQKQGKTLLLF